VTIPSDWLVLDLDSWLKLASVVGTILLWLWDRRRKPRLHAFFTHGASHQLAAAQGQQPGVINTHVLLVRNAGHAPAINVRITHALYPQHTAIQVWPAIPYTSIPNPPGGNELVFERLRPNEQLSISYIYPGGTTLDQFGTMVRFDEGFAQFFQINHARLVPRWARLIVYYLLLAGVTLTLYMVLKVILFTFLIV
jgi:hypothetical protein